MVVKQQPPAVLTIGGSDSGGAAGIQADMKTFTAWHVYGMSALTAVTAQNSARVAAVHYLPPAFVAAQIDAVLEDYGAAAVKTGYIGRVELVAAVAERLRVWQEQEGAGMGPLVVDPVLVDHRGKAMFTEQVTDAYRRLLLPLATLLVPNRAEAALLTGKPVDSLAAAGAATRALRALGADNVLVKGIRSGEEIVDLFYDGRELHSLPARRLETANTHGSGDTLAAAIAAGLALQLPLRAAVEQARAYTVEAIRGASGWQMGTGHGPLQHWTRAGEAPVPPRDRSPRGSHS
jgi:hydroxymethylpyrimidine/phosphomethylpyrimidine kinase